MTDKIEVPRDLLEALRNHLVFAYNEISYRFRPNIGASIDQCDALLREAAQPERCPLCSYEHGHSIGCPNNPVDIELRRAIDANRPKRAGPAHERCTVCPYRPGCPIGECACSKPPGSQPAGGTVAAGACVDAQPERRFRGVGELERTGYIPAGSAAEREGLSRDVAIPLDLMREVGFISDKYNHWRAVSPLAVDDPEYDFFAAGFKVALASVEAAIAADRDGS